MWDNSSPFDLTSCRPWQVPFYNIGPEDYNIPSNYLSNKPTRFISIYNNEATVIEENNLLDHLKLMGDINDIIPDVSTNLTIISYFKLDHAQKAMDYVNQMNNNSFQANFSKPCVVKKEHSQSLFIILTISTLENFDYKDHLLTFGHISSFSEATLSSNQKLLSIEFNDERVSQKIISKLNNVTLNGVNYKVYKCDNDRVLCSCYSAAKKNDLVIKRPYPKSISKPLDSKKEEPFSYFSEDPFSSTSSDTSATTVTLPDPPMINSPNELDMEKIASGDDRRTTFMIRNIPNKYSQRMLIESINKTHANTYDFLYLRMDFRNKCNVGYAFINFINQKSVISFAKQRIGKRWEFFNSDKRCGLSYAEIQGKESLIRKFKNSQVMREDEAFRPKLFYTSGPNKGKEEPFCHKPKENHSRHRHRHHNKKHAQKS